MWYMLENKESNRGTNREVNGKWDIREAIDIFYGRLYYKFTISSRKRCDFGNM